VIFIALALYINNSYFIDPDYIYLINGLNIFRGESYSIGHVDHPGTPLQILIGLFIKIIGTLRGTSNFSMDVLSNPQFYIKTIIICIAFFHSLIIYFIGKRYYTHQNNIIEAILLQSSFLLFDTVTTIYMKLFPDTIIPIGSLLIILITIEKMWGTMKDRIYSILSGLILGVFIAIKFTFLPMAIIPIIIASKWQNKILIPVYTGLIFFISILPVIDKLTYFRSFIFNIATHDGVYGTGNEEIINIPKMLNNMWNLIQVEYTFTLIFSLLFIYLIFVIYKNHFQSCKNNDIRILFALFANIVLQLILVSKQVNFRYMIPSLLISSFALTIIINKLKSVKIVYFPIVFLILISALYYNYKMTSKALEIKHSRNKTYTYIRDSIKSDDALIIVTEDSWFGSPFKSHSLMYGKLYCYRQGEQYDSLLERIYPNRFFWKHNLQQFSSWNMSVMPDLLINQYKKLYIYIQKDNSQVYQNTKKSFTELLKYQTLESISLNLVFSNTELREEIYLLTIQNPKKIKPKLKVISSFENRVEETNRILTTSDDSIFINEDKRLSELCAFEGKYSICILPDNPYGIAPTISNLKQNDFVRISIMCKRSSKQNECVIGLKSVIHDEGLIAMGSTSTEIINGWEKLEYSYRLNFTPSEQKVTMFIWNNSAEPMYFDNLNIEVY